MGRICNSVAGMIFVFVGWIIVTSVSISAEELVHQTQTDLSSGSFFQTVMDGMETTPEISLESYLVPTTIFDDDTIGAWEFDVNEPENVAEEDPDGQIHLYSEFGGLPNGSWAYASWPELGVPSRLSIEYLIYIDDVDSSGVEDPLVEQPTGSCCRLDVLCTNVGFRMEIFRDRMVSFYRVGETGIDYPITASIDSTSNIGQWYTIRCDIDFTDPELAVQIYRDGSWIGELKADARNAVETEKIRALVFSRGSSSGPAEMHVDRVKVNALNSELYSTGTYTSEVIELNASSLDTFSWTEVPAVPYPWESWTKYAGNPVLTATALPENILTDIDDPFQQPILYDGKYWLAYSSGGPGQAIHLAYSTDPQLFAWSDYESNPIIPPGTGEDYLFSPHIFKDGSTYYIFHDVALSSDSSQRLAYSTAPAPTGPWTRGQIILELGGMDEWDDIRVCEPFVLKEDSTYYLYYMGDHLCKGCGEQVGVATTSDELFPLGSETGGLWSKQGIVLSPDPDPEEWDGGYVSNPALIKVDDIFFMRYTGRQINGEWQLGTAWATSPMGPWHRPQDLSIGFGPPGSWDDERILRGAIHLHSGTWYTTYTGSSEPGGWDYYQGGLATADSRAVEDSILFETRTSPDGSTWEDWSSVSNGGLVQSTPDDYFQYRATFSLSAGGLSPTLRKVSMSYQTEATAVENTTPFVMQLMQPYPNPFNPRTVVRFTVDRKQRVRLAIYDVTGKRVVQLADGVFGVGQHRVYWDGRNEESRAVSSGVYFVRMVAKGFRKTRRIVLLR